MINEETRQGIIQVMSLAHAQLEDLKVDLNQPEYTSIRLAFSVLTALATRIQDGE